MSARFYLFNVGHGQCAALRLSTGEWWVFDMGCSPGLSPTRLMAHMEASGDFSPPDDFSNRWPRGLSLGDHLRITKCVVSHWHGDHLLDWHRMHRHCDCAVETVDWDDDYVDDALDSVEDSRRLEVLGALQGLVDHNAVQSRRGVRLRVRPPDVSVTTMRSSPARARILGGSSNSRTNNAGVVARVDCCGTSILLPGDIESNAWDHLLGRSQRREEWAHLVGDVDILVAPHHGHKSSFSSVLMEAARPSVVLASIRARDEHRASQYSKSEHVKSLRIDNGPGRLDHTVVKCVTTRRSGHIGIQLLRDGAGSPRRVWSTSKETF